MNLSTFIRDENTCQICEKNKLNFFFKIPRLPYKTVNNYSYQKKNYKSVALFTYGDKTSYYFWVVVNLRRVEVASDTNINIDTI
jgi:hypothetical protein